VQEDDRGLRVQHVVVDGHDLEAVLPERLEDRGNLARQHRDVAGDGGIRVRAHERCPRVQPHACVDRRPHLSQLQIVTPHGDLVDGSVLLAHVSGDLGDPGDVE
jgi:hypothetical protein